MMGEMGIDWAAVGGYAAQLAQGIGDLDAHARQAVGLWNAPGWVQERAWPFLAHRGGDWTGYNVPVYLALPILARRRNERQFRRRRHAGHHGGIRWATLVAAYRKMEPVRRWAVEGYTR